MKLKYFIDPGDVHVGFALFKNEGEGWYCAEAWESDPEAAEDLMANVVPSPNVTLVCFERFRLFGHLAMQQVGSEFRASQLIGVIKYLVRTRGHANLKLHVQDPNVQPVAEKWAAKKNILLLSVSLGKGPHAKSAELHGWFYLGRNNYKLKAGLDETPSV